MEKYVVNYINSKPKYYFWAFDQEQKWELDLVAVFSLLKSKYSDLNLKDIC